MPRFRRQIRWMLLVLGCITAPATWGCSDVPAKTPAETVGETPGCDQVAVQWTHTFGSEHIVGVGRVNGACGEGLVATENTWSLFPVDSAKDPSPCAQGSWPDGMVPDMVRNLANGGMLVTDNTAKRVLRLDAQGPSEWFSVGLSSSASVVEADEGPCGDRFVLLNDQGSRQLQRLDADGAVLWQKTGEFSSLAVACDSLYVGGTAVSEEQTSPYDIIDNDAWLARWTLSGDEQWRQKFSGQKNWSIAQVGVAGDGVGAEVTRRDQYIGQGTLHQLVWFDAAGVERIRHDIAPKNGVHIRTGDFPLQPQRWPADHIAWLVTSSTLGNTTCDESVWVASFRPDGTAELIRTLRLGGAAGWTVLSDGGLLVGGSNYCGLDDQSDWLMRLPVCK